MLSSRVFVLQAAALFSGAAAARCFPACSPLNPLVALLQSESDLAVPFCSEFLGLAASTVSAIVTPTVVATVTETNYITELHTEFEETITITVPASTSTLTPIKRHLAQRSVAYPDWLPASHPARKVSSACACLSIAPSVVTETATADPATVTEPITLSTTATTTVASFAVVTVTARPATVTQRVTIEVLRKDTGVSVGWIYNSNGPAIGNAAQAAGFTMRIPGGVASATQVRLDIENMMENQMSMGFIKESNANNIVELEDSYGSLALLSGTPPGSPPVVWGTSKRESDIWTVDTTTRMIGWQWIATNGGLPTIALWRVAGRLYPVGDVAEFMSATGGVSSNKYEVVLRYAVTPVPVPV